MAFHSKKPSTGDNHCIGILEIRQAETVNPCDQPTRDNAFRTAAATLANRRGASPSGLALNTPA
jgi:hypothetical protein